jgi:hypothetical protein
MRDVTRVSMRDMRRLIALPLWFFVGGYIGAVIAWALNINPILGPVLAVSLAGIIVIDPAKIIWTGQPQLPDRYTDPRLQ